MTIPVYDSTLADGAAVDAALGKAETALQAADVGVSVATAAQGAKADTAMQPGSNGPLNQLSALFNGAF
jgi:hypothetical protein